MSTSVKINGNEVSVDDILAMSDSDLIRAAGGDPTMLDDDETDNTIDHDVRPQVGPAGGRDSHIAAV